MRLSLIRGFVAENVRVGQAQTAGQPGLRRAAGAAAIEFSRAAATGAGNWTVWSCATAQFTLPLSPTNALTLTNLQTSCGFRRTTPGRSTISARILPARRSASAARWRTRRRRATGKYSPGTAATGATLTGSLRIFSDALRQIHFQGEPQLRLTLSGDARDVHSIAVRLNATATGVQTPWFAARDFQADATLTAPATAPTSTDAAWGFWTNLQPFRLAWSVQLGELRSEPLDASAIRCAGVWAAPALAVTNLAASLGGGRLTASATLDVATRELTFTNESQFDLHAVAELLTETARERLAQISWTQPPALQRERFAAAAAVDECRADWRDDISRPCRCAAIWRSPTRVAGGVKLDAVRTHFSYADLIWNLPDLTVAQGRTQLHLSGEESEATKDFHGRLTGRLDEASVARGADDEQRRARAGTIDLQRAAGAGAGVGGNLRTLETLCATGRVALTNFAVRGADDGFGFRRLYLHQSDGHHFRAGIVAGGRRAMDEGGRVVPGFRRGRPFGSRTAWPWRIRRR